MGLFFYSFERAPRLPGFSESMPQISPWQLGHSSGQRNGKHSFSQLSAVKGDVGEGEREVLMSERASECVGELVTINVEAGDGLMVYLLS